MSVQTQVAHAEAIAVSKLAVRATTSAGSGHSTTALSLIRVPMIDAVALRTTNGLEKRHRDPRVSPCISNA